MSYNDHYSSFPNWKREFDINHLFKTNFLIKESDMKDLLGAIAIHLLFAYAIIWLILNISS